MYKHIYNNFTWYHNGSIYFYSDPHFNDAEMQYLRKNYIGDEEQVRKINKKIGKNDTLVILGDIGDKEYIKKIRGYKVLVMGNHDAGATTYRGYGLFDEVYEGPIFISDKILLSHEPIDFPFALNIHGHDHSSWNGKDSLHLNVCAEHIDYTPISLREIIDSGRLSNISNIHRSTIDNATKRKMERSHSPV